MKKILIFTCIGGHNTVSTALQQTLSTEYKVSVKNIFLDTLQPLDFVSRVTRGRYTTEDLYSYMLKKQWHTLMNTALVNFGYLFFDLKAQSISDLINTTIQEVQPDVVISVIPFFNYFFAEITQKLQIPFILMPTDVDLTTFLYKMHNKNYSNLSITVPLDLDAAHKSLAFYNVGAYQVVQTGAALNPAFFKGHDLTDLKKKFLIPPHKPVILLLMGSQGSASLYKFAQEIAHIKDLQFHLIMVLGHNIQQKKQLDTITFGANISCNIFGFTRFIPELMSVSDLLITKSGGTSICEAMYMNLPMVLDATSQVLIWEQLNQEFVVQHQFGTTVKKLAALPETITHLIAQPALRNTFHANLMAHPKKNGCSEVKKLIDSFFCA